MSEGLRAGCGRCAVRVCTRKGNEKRTGVFLRPIVHCVVKIVDALGRGAHNKTVEDSRAVSRWTTILRAPHVGAWADSHHRRKPERFIYLLLRR